MLAASADPGAVCDDKTCASQIPNRFLPLHIAVARGHVEVVALLLGAGADVGARAEGEFTALHVACRFGQAAVIDRLFKVVTMGDLSGVTHTGDTPLHLLAIGGHVAAMKKFLAVYGATALTETNGDGMTVFVAAARFGHAAAAEALLEAHGEKWGGLAKYFDVEEAPVVVTNEDVFTGPGTDAQAVYLASKHGHVDVVEALLRAGLSADAYVDGSSAMEAAAANSPKILSLLKEAGGGTRPDPAASEYAALARAVVEGNSTQVAKLLEEGADVNEVAPNGATALLLAAHKGVPKITQQLLDAKADLTHTDKNGFSALTLAAYGG